MIKERIDVLDHATEIMKAVKTGVLLTSKAGDRVNSMTISWGTLGIEWNTPIFTTFVRESRFTRELLEKSDSFSINIPLEGADRKHLAYLGSHSGRDSDKIKDLGLTLVPGEKISTPAIKDYALTLECKIVHKQLQAKEGYQMDKNAFYPQNNEGKGDYHIEFVGEIVDAYIIKD